MWISKLFLIKNDYLLTHLIIEKTDAEAEAPILWPCDVKSWLTGNDPDVGKDWGQDEKRETEEEMVWWHHWLYGYKFVQYLREVKDRKPGMLQPMGSQRVGHDWITKQLQHVKTDSLSGNALITVKIILFFSKMSTYYFEDNKIAFLEKVSFHSNSKKGSAKECSNYCTTAPISHVSKVMLKVLQARLQQYVNRELPNIQDGFSKGRGTRDQTANICWIIK